MLPRIVAAQLARGPRGMRWNPSLPVRGFSPLLVGVLAAFQSCQKLTSEDKETDAGRTYPVINTVPTTIFCRFCVCVRARSIWGGDVTGWDLARESCTLCSLNRGEPLSA